eukprot:6528326-Alexandrium_andersonii.AAC.1
MGARPAPRSPAQPPPPVLTTGKAPAFHPAQTAQTVVYQPALHDNIAQRRANIVHHSTGDPALLYHVVRFGLLSPTAVGARLAGPDP